MDNWLVRHREYQIWYHTPNMFTLKDPDWHCQGFDSNERIHISVFVKTVYINVTVHRYPS